MNKSLILVAACALALAACDKNEKTENKTDTPAATATAATTATAEPVAKNQVTINDTDLSTPADFEESAAKAITAKTYKAELASIDTEMSKD